MTLPGDSLNHVHIRSEREFDFALPDVCTSSHACLVRERLQIQGDMLSPSSY